MKQVVILDTIRKLSDRKGRYVDELTQAAINNSKILKTILEGILSTNDVYRYNCFKVLSSIGLQRPERLYPEWRRFELLLQSKNAFHRGIAVNIIAQLTKVDNKRRFEKIFDEYFDLLNDASLMVARYVALSAGEIARAKLKSANQITAKLLKVGELHFDKGRRDLIAGDVLQSIEKYFDALTDEKEIIAFAKRLRRSKSPRGKKAAEKFLEKHCTI